MKDKEFFDAACRGGSIHLSGWEEIQKYFNFGEYSRCELESIAKEEGLDASNPANLYQQILLEQIVDELTETYGQKYDFKLEDFEIHIDGENSWLAFQGEDVTDVSDVESIVFAKWTCVA